MAAEKCNMKTFIRSITCTMCMDIISIPHSLECTHSYCESCIAGLPRDRRQGQSVICCPLCKSHTVEKEVKHNVTMQAMVKWYETNNNLDNTFLCQLCSNSCEQNCNLGFCENCQVFICVTCQERHDRSHKIKCMVKGDERKISSVYLPRACEEHFDWPVTHYCETCDTLICSTCLAKSHKSHRTSDFALALANILPCMKEHLDKIQQNTHELQQSIANINKQRHSAKSNREAVRKQVLAEQEKKIAKIKLDTQEILQQLNSQDELEQKEITNVKKDLEHTFSCQESLLNWCRSILQVAEGPGLLHEINSELLSKTEAFANEPLNLEDEVLDIPQFTFQPTKLTATNLIGTLDTTEEDNFAENYNHNRGRKISVFNDDINPLLKRRASSFTEQRRSSIMAHMRRASLYDHRPGKKKLNKSQYLYRQTSINLNMLESHEIDEVDSFKLDKLSQKLCFFDGKLWFPCHEEKDSCIEVYKGGDVVKTIKNAEIICPHSLHPANHKQLVVASDSGLFLINSNGEVVSQLLHGQFWDVCADENYIVALEKVSDKVHKIRVLQNSDAFSERNGFTLPDDNADTILLLHNRIFVSTYQEDNLARIMKYTVSGEKLSQFGEYGRSDQGQMNYPRISLADVNGSALVADCNNCRLQVVDVKGKFTVVKQAIGYPWDVIIADDGFMYILCGLYQYGYVQKCKIC